MLGFPRDRELITSQAAGKLLSGGPSLLPCSLPTPTALSGPSETWGQQPMSLLIHLCCPRLPWKEAPHSPSGGSITPDLGQGLQALSLLLGPLSGPASIFSRSDFSGGQKLLQSLPREIRLFGGDEHRIQVAGPSRWGAVPRASVVPMLLYFSKGTRVGFIFFMPYINIYYVYILLHNTSI